MRQTGRSRVWVLRWKLDPELREIVRPCAVLLDALYYGSDSQWPKIFEKAVLEWHQTHSAEDVQQHPVFLAVRQMFKKTGLDPTKYRPSSEALARRVLKEKSLPFIHPAVALNNIISLSFLLPMGCYDPEQLGPNLTFRLGRPGETFTSLRQKIFHAEGRLIIADNGPCGSPIVDSIRTALRPESRACLYVFYTPIDVEQDYVDQAMSQLCQWARTYRIGRPARLWVYDPSRDFFVVRNPPDIEEAIHEEETESDTPGDAS